MDADRITRELQAPGQPVLAAMVARFGEEILAADGSLDRQVVAEQVFGDPEALAALNDIVHPAVGERIAAELAAAGEDEVVVLDVPLLVETGMADLAALVVVDADPEVAVRRLVEQRGLSEADARARMARQATRQERLARADVVIANDGDLDELRRQVDEAWERLEALR